MLETKFQSNHYHMWDQINDTYQINNTCKINLTIHMRLVQQYVKKSNH